MNIHIISTIVTHKDRLPEKPSRAPNIAGRLAKKNSKLKKNKQHVHTAGIQID